MRLARSARGVARASRHRAQSAARLDSRRHRAARDRHARAAHGGAAAVDPGHAAGRGQALRARTSCGWWARRTFPTRRRRCRARRGPSPEQTALVKKLGALNQSIAADAGPEPGSARHPPRHRAARRRRARRRRCCRAGGARSSASRMLAALVERRCERRRARFAWHRPSLSAQASCAFARFGGLRSRDRARLRRGVFARFGHRLFLRLRARVRRFFLRFLRRFPARLSSPAGLASRQRAFFARPERRSWRQPSRPACVFTTRRRVPRAVFASPAGPMRAAPAATRVAARAELARHGRAVQACAARRSAAR